ncbi:Pol [Symbiodinium sp. CCMP2592]|nr:Pol [Symbiodinium sp. CCMP2592]
MIIGGDFNTSCTTAKPHVGTGLLPPPPNWALDQEDFQALLVGLGLCAINTFTDSGSPHTFAWGSQRSHIDFLLIRCDMADRFSRMARPLHEYPVGAWRGGPKHYPVFACIPWHWCPWQRTGTMQRKLQIDRHAIADALAGKDDERVSSFRQELQACLPQDGAALQSLHDVVYTIAVKHFPRKPPVRGPRPWQDGTLQQYAAHMWGHLRLLRRWAQRSGAARCRQALFRCWYHSTKYWNMHRRAQQQGKSLRRARRQTMLAEAEQAISSGQSRLFYQLIDKLAPKGRFRKFQMNKGGQILTPQEELETMRKHFLQVFNHGSPAQPLAVPGIADVDPPTLQVEPLEVQHFLDKLPARKAGASGTVPGAAWSGLTWNSTSVVCLDLSSAFDMVPRHLVAEALHDAGISGAPAELLMSWLSQCKYALHIDQLHADIPTTRGVKQGCPASPLLFACFMTLVTKRIDVLLVASLMPGSPAVLLCTQMTSTLEIFSAQAILTMDGAQRGTAMQKLTKQTDDGRMLRIHVKTGEEYLPIVKQADYLGAVTTYASSAVRLPRAALRRTFEASFGRQEPDDAHVMPFEHPWNRFLAAGLAEPAATGRDASPGPESVSDPLYSPPADHQVEAATPGAPVSLPEVEARFHSMGSVGQAHQLLELSTDAAARHSQGFCLYDGCTALCRT